MSTIMIRDLAQSRDLDRRVMCAVRGGSPVGRLPNNVIVNVNTNTNTNTTTTMTQIFNMFNHSRIANFSLDLNALQRA